MTFVTTDSGGGWLILAFQLPARPTAARMRAWRQLQRIGALPVKGGAYVLPHTPQAREDLEWLRTEIVAHRGDAILFAGDPVDAATAGALAAAFRTARAKDFTALARDAERAGRRAGSAHDTARRRAVRQLTERLEHLDTIDFFGATEREAAAAAVRALQRQPGGAMERIQEKPALKAAAYRGRTWVTRPRPGIDRFACGWLIRRFIDADASFVFAPDAEAAAREFPRAIPFDMYGVEFGHQDAECSFETLIRRFRLRDSGLEPLARLVHAVDLKDDRYVVPEASTIQRVVEGLRRVHEDDATLLSRGIETIEALYAGGRTLGKKRPSRR